MQSLARNCNVTACAVTSRSCDCNSYRYRIVKEQQALARDPRETAASSASSQTSCHSLEESDAPLTRSRCSRYREQRPAPNRGLTFHCSIIHPMGLGILGTPSPVVNCFLTIFSFPFPRGLWRRPGSNRQPPACKTGALPIELRPPWLRISPHWANLDSNQGPQLYQSCALAN